MISIKVGIGDKSNEVHCECNNSSELYNDICNIIFGSYTILETKLLKHGYSKEDVLKDFKTIFENVTDEIEKEQENDD